MFPFLFVLTVIPIKDLLKGQLFYFSSVITELLCEFSKLISSEDAENKVVCHISVLSRSRDDLSSTTFQHYIVVLHKRMLST